MGVRTRRCCPLRSRNVVDGSVHPTAVAQVPEEVETVATGCCGRCQKYRGRRVRKARDGGGPGLPPPQQRTTSHRPRWQRQEKSQ
jgi:hypothetical protein